MLQCDELLPREVPLVAVGEVRSHCGVGEECARGRHGHWWSPRAPPWFLEPVLVVVLRGDAVCDLEPDELLHLSDTKGGYCQCAVIVNSAEDGRGHVRVPDQVLLHPQVIQERAEELDGRACV